MYPCPVCGYLVFIEPPGSYDICDVCGWEDDALQLEYASTLAGGANRTTVVDAQRIYATIATRLSRKNEGVAISPRRDPTWRIVDPSRDTFPAWGDDNAIRAPALDERLYYWKDTFWNREKKR